MRFAHQVDGKSPDGKPSEEAILVECLAAGRIAGGAVVFCYLGREHPGPHWDDEDEMWWQHDEPHG